VDGCVHTLMVPVSFIAHYCQELLVPDWYHDPICTMYFIGTSSQSMAIWSCQEPLAPDGYLVLWLLWASLIVWTSCMWLDWAGYLPDDIAKVAFSPGYIAKSPQSVANFGVPASPRCKKFLVPRVPLGLAPPVAGTCIPGCKPSSHPRGTLWPG
jgi:hypothetical protein